MGKLPIDLHRLAQAPGRRFESPFDDVVGVASGQLLDVQGALGFADEAKPEFLHQLRVKFAHLLGGDGQIKAQVAPAG